MLGLQNLIEFFVHPCLRRRGTRGSGTTAPVPVRTMLERLEVLWVAQPALVCRLCVGTGPIARMGS